MRAYAFDEVRLACTESARKRQAYFDFIFYSL